MVCVGVEPTLHAQRVLSPPPVPFGNTYLKHNMCLRYHFIPEGMR
jgi:hypothetical protein